jgi:hypothetical protein
MIDFELCGILLASWHATVGPADINMLEAQRLVCVLRDITPFVRADQ